MHSSSTVHLPDGQTFTVHPVFGGLFFKSLDMNKHHPSPFPIGWTVVIHTEDDSADANAMAVDTTESLRSPATANNQALAPANPLSHSHSFTTPTLQNDTLYISSISNPSAADYKPPASPTRQIAMMLWITLYWYFQQPRPTTTTLPPTDASRHTTPQGRPRGDWRISIRRDGVLRARNLLPKLERMGLLASTNASVGGGADDAGDEWVGVGVAQRAFWQIPGRLFLFTLQPAEASSRPSTPVSPGFHDAMSPLASPGCPAGPFHSSSHLPTYYPPPPLQYTLSGGVRHPLRPKPPRMGEVFYTRFVPSVGQYLSFRVASSSAKAVPHLGPVSPAAQQGEGGAAGNPERLMGMCDIVLVQKWLSNPRVAKFWGGPSSSFLNNALASRHSFPVIGMWDGVPFGYFEIYWVKEDVLGRYVDAGDFDRGLHVFVGEEWARGRVAAWMSALVHWVFCADNRTMSVCMEPRVDNERFIRHLQDTGFVGQKEISFPHKQSWFGRLSRENWEGPSL